MQNTNIEWCDHTFNGWTGCTKVSPGCANCYAEAWSKRSGIVQWGKGNPRRRTSASNWKQPFKWNKQAAKDLEDWNRHMILHGGNANYPQPRRPRVFCSSLADWLDDEVPIDWLSDLLCLIGKTPQLDWLLLTKRPGNWSSRIGAVASRDDMGAQLASSWGLGRIPPNVWIGTTVENQQMANQRIPQLLKIPALIRFLSCEPLLGPVDLRKINDNEGNSLNALTGDWAIEGRGHTGPRETRIHWVISGGESGSNPRPMHPLWVRSLRDQAQAANVPFLFKQWGEWVPTCAQYPATDAEHDEAEDCGLYGDIALALDGSIMPEGFQPDCPRTWLMNRVGKKTAGRLLDGLEYLQFPNPSTALLCSEL